MFKTLTNGVGLAKEFMASKIGQGSLVLDATAGNGYDTVFLAELVGDNGKVYAFDIQASALENCRLALRKAGLEHRAELVLDSHHRLDEYVTRPIDGAMFNLGYLPKGNHKIITTPETTVISLEKTLKILKPGGIVSIMVYYGHPGGDEEKRALEEFLSGLNQKNFSIAKIDFINRVNRPPFLLLVEKAGDSDEKQKT